MEISYCEGWFRHFKKIVKPLKKDMAKKLDEEKKPYTVIIGKSEKPHCFIEINSGCYGVSFLDELNREYLSYNFEEQENGMLFLKEAVYSEYEGDTDNMIKNTVYWFSTNGTSKIEKTETPFRKAELTESKIDVSKNWENKPKFGNYEDIIKKER